MNTKACIEHLERLAGLRAKYPDAWYNLGLVLAHAGRTAEALAAVNRSLEIHPLYLDALITRAFLLGESGRHAEGFREFKRIHVRSADDFTTVHALGVYCLRNGWKDVGMQQLQRAERMRPKLPYLLLEIAAAAFNAGDASTAQEKLYKARAIVEDVAIGSLLAGFPVQASSLPAHCLWDDPMSAKVHVILSNFAGGSGDMEEAEQELLRGARSLPGHWQVFWHMGKLLSARGRPGEAEAWLAALARLDEDCPQAHLELSFVHAERGDLARAVEALRKALALRPLFPDYHHHLGTLLVDLGRVDEGIAELEKVQCLHPSYGDTPIHLASAYLQKGSPETALSVLASSPCAAWPEALLLSAQAHLQGGQKLKAREILEKALAADPSNRTARALLAENAETFQGQAIGATSPTRESHSSAS